MGNVSVPQFSDSYLLHVYVLHRLDCINGVNFWLLRRSSLGSRTTLSPPYSLSGIQQRHTHQHHRCQDTAPYSRHPNKDSNNLSPVGFLRFLCSYFSLKSFLHLFCNCVCPVCLLFPICLTQSQRQTESMYKETKRLKQTM